MVLHKNYPLTHILAIVSEYNFYNKFEYLVFGDYMIKPIL